MPWDLSIFKLRKESKINDVLSGFADSSFISITVTPTELSIVSEEKYEKFLEPYLISDNIESQRLTWKALRVSGQLDFSLVGILAKLSSILAKSCISIFAVSTFDTDYILVMKQHVDKAVDALKKESYNVKIV